jgi:hypothetical protein
MTKLFTSLRYALLAAASVTTLAGCDLYFGESEGGGRPGAQEPGFSCTDNADCAAGCYCGANSTCEEAGFCTTNEDCAEGFVCDDRGSCVPATCSADAECQTGEVCQDGTCTATCVCTTDTQAQDLLGTSDAYCDEARETCHLGVDPAGYCTGALTCNEKPPTCDVGTTPLIADGCYTGECKAIAQCEAAPACEELQHLEDCQGRPAECSVVATGTNCTTPGGGICQPGDTNCTCENFTFHSCETAGGGN